jgi:hypothetical protein
MKSSAIIRDFFESQLCTLFCEKLLPTEQAFEIINAYKSKNFAFSQVGLMLDTNGYNLRGISNRYPNGLIYFDSENVFGIGIFNKESSENSFPHLMIIAPQDPSFLTAVMKFISKVRQYKIFSNKIYWSSPLTAEVQEVLVSVEADEVFC